MHWGLTPSPNKVSPCTFLGKMHMLQLKLCPSSVTWYSHCARGCSSKGPKLKAHTWFWRRIESIIWTLDPRSPTRCRVPRLKTKKFCLQEHRLRSINNPHNLLLRHTVTISLPDKWFCMSCIRRQDQWKGLLPLWGNLAQQSLWGVPLKKTGTVWSSMLDYLHTSVTALEWY